MKKLGKQILRFGVVGGTAFIIDYGVLYCLTEFAGINYLVSACISFVASVIYNYVLSILWVFDAKQGRSKTAELAVFIGLSVVGLGLNQLGMWLLVDKAGIYYMLAKIVVTAIVMVYNFITRKLFIEGKAPDGEREPGGQDSLES